MSSDEINLKQYTSGMKREDKSEKIDYTLALDGPMFERYARHMTKGAKLHGKRNWLKACGDPELEDFKAGAMRHMFQWLRGDTDEDHAAAIIFNINGAELVRYNQCVTDPLTKRGLGSQSAQASSVNQTADPIESIRKLLNG